MSDDAGDLSGGATRSAGGWKLPRRHEPSPMTGEELAKAMAWYGVNARVLARALGLGEARVVSWLEGRTPIPWDVVDLLLAIGETGLAPEMVVALVELWKPASTLEAALMLGAASGVSCAEILDRVRAGRPLVVSAIRSPQTAG